MNHHRLACLIIILIAAGIFFYQAQCNCEDTITPVPEYEGQFGSLAVVPSVLLKDAGTALDMRPECHFWVPEYDPMPTHAIVTPHRYPTVPGGNVSTVMHHGWKGFAQRAPSKDNDWYDAPPEVAVL